MGKKSYSNYNNPKYRTRKYSHKKLLAYRRKNEAALKLGLELAEKVKKPRKLVPLAEALKDPELAKKIHRK